MNSAGPFDWEWSVVDHTVLGPQEEQEVRLRTQFVEQRLAGFRYPEIASVEALHLPATTPTVLRHPSQVSPGIASPLIEEGRVLAVHEDFKFLSDLRRQELTPEERASWQQLLGSASPDRAARRERLSHYLHAAYAPEAPITPFDAEPLAPRWELDHPDGIVQTAFRHVESHWAMLVKTSAEASGGSLLRSPYPFLIPAGRFREAYYWDSCLGIDGLLATGRHEIARMLADNLLESIRRFGFVPNGSREYYLSRSQPPLSAHTIRSIVEASDADYRTRGDSRSLSRLGDWVRQRAVPLLAREFLDFWSDPATRFDARTGLHHHWDALDIRRPERHSVDCEETLGRSYRDVRAMAESGLDFTLMYGGGGRDSQMTRVAPVMLNSLLAQFADDLSFLCAYVGLHDQQRQFQSLAQARKTAINAQLWDEASGRYRHRHLDTGQTSRGQCFTVFTPLFAGLANDAQARRTLDSARALFRSGGIAASTLTDSPHQWDGDNGWAPAQIFAVQGLLRYGWADDARRIARNWVDALARIHHWHGQFFERIDVERGDLARREGEQYPVQQGFLWTNSSFVWMATSVLGHELRPMAAAAA